MTNFDKQLQKEASQLMLTEQEKSAMRGVLARAVIDSVPTRPTVSPYVSYVWSIPRVAMLSLVVLVVAGGGTTFAAEGALPGDALYTVKVRVAEPITEALQFSPKAKAAWHIAVAEKRANEAEVLTAEGRLSPEAAAEIASNFDTHAAAALSHAAQVEAEDPESGGELSTKVVVTLQAHSAILAALGETATSRTIAHTATELATHFSLHTAPLLAYESRTPGSEEYLNKRPERELVRSQNEKVVHTMSADTMETTDDSTSTQSTTTVTSAPSGMLPQPEPKRIRATAEVAIAVLEKKLSVEVGAVDASEKARFEAGILDAKGLIAQGDAATEQEASVQAYTEALRAALSLTAYLRANASFPNANLLPTLLKPSPDVPYDVKGEE